MIISHFRDASKAVEDMNGQNYAGERLRVELSRCASCKTFPVRASLIGFFAGEEAGVEVRTEELEEVGEDFGEALMVEEVHAVLTFLVVAEALLVQ